MKLSSKKKEKVIGGSKFDSGEGSKRSNAWSSSIVKQGPTVQRTRENVLIDATQTFRDTAEARILQ